MCFAAFVSSGLKGRMKAMVIGLSKLRSSRLAGGGITCFLYDDEESLEVM